MIHTANSIRRVAVLDIVKTPGRHSPMVLLQPSPRLQDVFPSMDLSDTTKLNHQLPNLDSAYVGVLEETGSLFAMSSDRFPLVAFGDANPNSMHPLIDPPPGTPLSTEATPKSNVDEITKARKLRELCDSGSLDLRCLTGIRKLESSSRSRLSRLLDAAPVLQSTTSVFPTPSFIESPADNKSLVDLLLPWPNGQVPGQNLQSNLPLWLLILLSSIIGWVVIGRKKWGSTKSYDSAQSLEVHHEFEQKSVERTLLVDRIAPEQPPNRSDPPEVNSGSTVDGDAPIEKDIPVEETGESGKEEPMATPMRKKPLRRRRGKKKGPNLAALADANEPEGEIETDTAAGVAEEEQGKIQLIVPTLATTAATSPALFVSDEILGMSWFMHFTSAPDQWSRFRFPRNRGFQRIVTGPCRRSQTSPSGLCHVGHPRS